MIVLTDRPEAMTGLFVPPRPAAEWRRAEALDSPTDALWATLGGGAAPWSLDLPADRDAARFWSRLILIADAPGSQFDLLRDRLASVVRSVGPAACVALDGRSFHGHRGRPWSAVPGNLHLSVALPVTLPASIYAPCLSMLPAVATVDAVVAATGGAVQPGVKWVNDILVPSGKLAGVLTATQVLGRDIDLVVIGIGLNVAKAPAIAPTPFVPRAAALDLCPGGSHVTLGAMLWALLDSLAQRLMRLDAASTVTIWQDYVRSSVVVGRRVRVWNESATETADVMAWPPPIAAGVVTDIGPDLGLAISGQPDRVTKGRLAFEESCRTFGL